MKHSHASRLLRAPRAEQPPGQSRLLHWMLVMGITAPALATLVGVSGAMLGLWLTGMRRRARMVVPFSAGVLLGVALFGLIPELAAELGWLLSGLLFAGGYGALLLV